MPKLFNTPRPLLIVFILAQQCQILFASEVHECPQSISSEFCVSMVSLLANPEAFDNRKVQVKGFMNLQFEGNAIYFHKEDYENMLSSNAIWLNLRGVETPNFNKTYVLVEGTFLAGKRGHFGSFSGELTDITRITNMLSRSEIEDIIDESH